MDNKYYFLKTSKIKQRFFKPNSTHESIIFEDDSVLCPNENQYRSNKGNVSISAICQDCQSLVEYEKLLDTLICQGRPMFEANTTSVKDYLDLNECSI